MFQVLAFGGVVGQADRAFISRDGLFCSSEPVHQVRAGGFGRLEAAGVVTGFLQQRIERGQSRRGPVDLGGHGGKGDTVPPAAMLRSLVIFSCEVRQTGMRLGLARAEVVAGEGVR
jgi:hypothetical protein